MYKVNMTFPDGKLGFDLSVLLADYTEFPTKPPKCTSHRREEAIAKSIYG